MDDSITPPIIIVCAARSGSKMLRGVLDSHPRLTAFPHELNYLWRHGNARAPHDELRAEHARPEVINYIRQAFRRMMAELGNQRLVEKTTANSLRVDFVRCVFPEAFIIHLVRDGRSVAESARRRWKAPLEPTYLLSKARWVPSGDVPYYAMRYLRYRLGRLFTREGQMGSWGPQFQGMAGLVGQMELLELCALQWRKCVEAAAASLERIDVSQKLTIRYEDFVSNARQETRRLLDSLGLDPAAECLDHVQREVRSDYVDLWKERLSPGELSRLNHVIGDLLGHLGYDPSLPGKAQSEVGR